MNSTADNAPNFPWVELWFTDDPTGLITRVPPEYLKSLRYTSSNTEMDEFSIQVIDPEFTVLEPRIMKAVRKTAQNTLKGNQIKADTAPLRFRFGYPEKNLWSPQGGKWFRGHILSYSPAYTKVGMDITIAGSLNLDQSSINSQGGSFEGTASELVEYLCKEDGRVVSWKIIPSKDQSRVWAVPAFQEWWTWVQNTVRYIAVGPNGEQPYICMGNNDKDVYFGPYTGAGVTWNWNYGLRNTKQLVSFTPNVPADQIGSLIMDGQAIILFNPTRKQYTKVLASYASSVKGDDALPVSPVDEFLSDVRKVLHTETNLVKKNEAGQPGEAIFPSAAMFREYIDQNAQGVTSLPEDDDNPSEEAAIGMWREFVARVLPASAELILDEETMFIRGNDLAQITVLLPDSTVHWTSGVYRIFKATFEIGMNSKITLDLYKAFEMNQAGGTG